jgi:hypothetical protein
MTPFHVPGTVILGSRELVSTHLVMPGVGINPNIVFESSFPHDEPFH